LIRHSAFDIRRRRFGLAIGRVLCAAATLALGSGPALGVVLHEGSGQPAPADRPPDAVVGRWNNSSGGLLASLVVIGPDYAITTRHQEAYEGANPTVVIDDVTYHIADVFNHGLADLRVVRLETLAGAPANLTAYADIYTGSDEASEPMTIGGFGRVRNATLTQTVPPYYPYGYSWKSNAALNWGCNTVDGSALAADASYTSLVLGADFDAAVVYGDEDPANERGWVAFEASPATADSGGGWFLPPAAPGGRWQVIGLSRAVERLGESRFRNPATGDLDPDGMDAVWVRAYADWINGVLDRGTWEGDASSAWANPANWSGAVPDGADAYAVFGALGGGSYAVSLAQPQTVGTLRFSSAAAYAVAASGDGRLVFDGVQGVAVIEVEAGAHAISAPITLNDLLRVLPAAGGSLTLSGPLSGAGGLRMSGGGVLVLGGSNAFTGDVQVDLGTLRVTAAGGLAGRPVDLRGGILDLCGDAGTDFASAVTVKGDAEIRVGPLAGGAGQTHTLGDLDLRTKTLKVTGSDGYRLAFDGAITLGDNPYSTATLDVQTADLVLSGPVTFTGTIVKTGPGTLIIGDPGGGAGAAAGTDLGPGFALAEPGLSDLPALLGESPVATFLDPAPFGPWDLPVTTGGTGPTEVPWGALGDTAGGVTLPEPATLALLAFGICLTALGGAAKQRRRHGERGTRNAERGTGNAPRAFRVPSSEFRVPSSGGGGRAAKPPGGRPHHPPGPGHPGPSAPLHPVGGLRDGPEFVRVFGAAGGGDGPARGPPPGEPGRLRRGTGPGLSALAGGPRVRHADDGPAGGERGAGAAGPDEHHGGGVGVCEPAGAERGAGVRGPGRGVLSEG
jgi:autotransporter-associated beta strand protein